MMDRVNSWGDFASKLAEAALSDFESDRYHSDELLLKFMLYESDGGFKIAFQILERKTRIILFNSLDANYYFDSKEGIADSANGLPLPSVSSLVIKPFGFM